jgi:transposase InsO family protein
MNGKVERCERTVGEEFHSRHFYESLEDMEEGLRTYVEYYNKFRPHMGLHGLTPY